MKKLRALYNQLARFDFGFSTGTFTAYLAFCFFVYKADSVGFSNEDIIFFTIKTGSTFVGCVFGVRIFFAMLFEWLYRRSYTIEGEIKELQEEIDSLRDVVTSDLNASHTLKLTGQPVDGEPVT